MSIPGRIDFEDGQAEALLAELKSLAPEDPRREEIRTELVRMHLPIARGIARRYAQYDEPFEDVQQAAMLGLVKAINRFDSARGERFLAYAGPTMTGEVKRHFRDRTWAIRVPRRLQELRLEITAANNTLTHTLGRAPTVADVAVHLGITDEEVLEGLEGARAYNTASLSTPLSDDGATSLGDTLGDEDHGYELAELRIALGPAVAALDEREQHILALRFHGNLTQTEIADHIGISQMHVSRLLTKALAKLRRTLDA
jgi:RNA polymerase sigma-B factor